MKIKFPITIFISAILVGCGSFESTPQNKQVSKPAPQQVSGQATNSHSGNLKQYTSGFQSKDGFQHSGGKLEAVLSSQAEDFDLYLQKKNDAGYWTDVAESLGYDSNETITYNGDSGTYRWEVYAYEGSGQYTLKETRPGQPKPPSNPSNPNRRATVLKHGWDIPNASRLAKMANEFNNSPFDGVIFSGGSASNTLTHQRISDQVIENSLKPLDGVQFKANTKNYMIIYTASVNGGFSGSGVNNLVENMRSVARAAKKRGIAGIALDNEVYDQGDPWKMPQACPGLNRKACGEAAFKAGKRMMEAMIKEWPEMKLLAFFGPYINDPRTYDWINRYAKANDWSNKRDIKSEFLIGIFAATVGTQAQFVDGGELYGLRKQEDYRKTAEWNRVGMVDGSPFIPNNLKAAYKQKVGISFGLYDDRVPQYRSVPKVTPKIWNSMIKGAVQEADVVWLYTEIHDWWKTDGMDWPKRSPKHEGTLDHVTRDWYDATVDALK